MYGTTSCYVKRTYCNKSTFVCYLIIFTKIKYSSRFDFENSTAIWHLFVVASRGIKLKILNARSMLLTITFCVSNIALPKHRIVVVEYE